MKYKLIITRIEDNTNFAEELKKFEEDNRRRNYGMNNDGSLPQREFVENALTCELTEEQFKSVKAECFKTFQ